MVDTIKKIYKEKYNIYESIIKKKHINNGDNSFIYTESYNRYKNEIINYLIYFELLKYNKLDIKDYNKNLSKAISKEKRKHSTTTFKNCALCDFDFNNSIKIGKNAQSKIDSHNIPQSILKNVVNDIELNGKVNRGVLNMDYFIGFGTTSPNQQGKEHIGIGDTDCFRNICSVCDRNYFKIYENNLLNFNTYFNTMEEQSEYRNKILCEIALKISCRDLYDYTINLNKNLNYQKYNIDVTKKHINKYKNIIDGVEDTNMNLIFYTELDYDVGFTIQDKIACHKLLDEEFVFNRFTNKVSESSPNLYFAIYPIKNMGHTKSIILIFSDEDSNNIYLKFKKYMQEKNVKLDDKLSELSYLMIKYSENLYLNPSKFLSVNFNTKTKLLAIYGDPIILKGNDTIFSSENDVLDFLAIHKNSVNNLFKIK